MEGLSGLDWIEVCIHTTQEAMEIVSNLLHEAGSNGVVIEDPHDLVHVWDTSLGEVYELNPEDYPESGVYVKGYFPDDEHWEQKLSEIREAVEKLDDEEIDFGEKKIIINQIHEEDWSTAWKQYYKPIQVTDKMTITPSWEQYAKKRDDEIVITLDPGMAFGTGTHETTNLCLQALEKYVKPGDSVIDVGTGTGILSIASALLGARKVYGYDLDPVAIKSAKTNIELNGVQSIVSISENDLLNGVDIQADIIVANLLASLIIELMKDVPKALKKGGTFIASGIIKNQLESVKEKIESEALAVKEVLLENDWVAIVACHEEEN